jgi:putative SOS response-associated peptidase YedK
VIIGSAQLDDWLTGDAVAALAMMSPAPGGLLKATKVSKRVNSVKNDDPDCIAERGQDDQGSLF